MKSYPIVILGGGVGAGYAAREFAAQSGKKGEALENARNLKSLDTTFGCQD